MTGIDCVPDGSALMRAALQYIRETSARRQPPDVSPSGKGAALLCVVNSNFPTGTSAQVVYTLAPLGIDCDDTEGAEPTFAETGETISAINCGSQLAPQLALVLVEAVGGRWVFQYD